MDEENKDRNMNLSKSKDNEEKQVSHSSREQGQEQINLSAKTTVPGENYETNSSTNEEKNIKRKIRICQRDRTWTRRTKTETSFI